MPIDTITPAYQPPKIEDEPVDVDVIDPDLNTRFKENAPHQGGNYQWSIWETRKGIPAGIIWIAHTGWQQEFSAKVFT